MFIVWYPGFCRTNGKGSFRLIVHREVEKDAAVSPDCSGGFLDGRLHGSVISHRKTALTSKDRKMRMKRSTGEMYLFIVVVDYL